ncbi:MAG: general secretion pathway protein GspB [Gammaproteobacteria bacterium]
MSFILDALRKSDTERRQQAGPALATTTRHAPQARHGIWVPLLILLLTVNAAIVAWRFLRDANEPPSASPITQADDDPQPGVRSLRDEVEAAPVRDDGARGVPSEPPPADATKPPVSAPAVPVDAAAPMAAAPADPSPDTMRDALPNFEQLRVGGIISTPPLHLDIHVFANDPSQRFVFINMNKYRERDRMSEGPVVEEITDDGVILTHQGIRFTLDRN